VPDFAGLGIGSDKSEACSMEEILTLDWSWFPPLAKVSLDLGGEDGAEATLGEKARILSFASKRGVVGLLLDTSYKSFFDFLAIES